MIINKTRCVNILPFNTVNEGKTYLPYLNLLKYRHRKDMMHFLPSHFKILTLEYFIPNKRITKIPPYKSGQGYKP